MIISKEIHNLSSLVEKLKGETCFIKKHAILLDFLGPISSFSQFEKLYKTLEKSGNLGLQVIFLSLIAINQGDHLFQDTKDIFKFLEPLENVEIFYESIGGLVGYHFKTLTEINNKKKFSQKAHYTLPNLYDIRNESDEQAAALMAGIHSIPQMGEIYLVGGLGDRLKLKTLTGDPLPAATLTFCGKSLLEILLRDLFGREYLYFKLFNKKVTIPVALMTSLEKENETHIRQLLKQNKWFDRGEKAFFLFRQVLVPVITEEGDWVLKDDGELLLHPGGHGTLWKAAEEEGVYTWFEGLNKSAFLIRQINNPIAGVDSGLLALAGFGFLKEKTFGIASCERAQNAAEGILVHVEKSAKEFATINIEYTEFNPTDIAYQSFPTNTNILFVHLQNIKEVIKKHPIPDFLLNMKTKLHFKSKEVLAGRLESMVQNITHHLTSAKKTNHPVFLTYNERGKTISTTKRSFDAKNGLLETPEGAFYDLMKEGHSLLCKKCGVKIPSFSSVEKYLKDGPSLLFLYNPALGPLYDIISQKICGGEITNNSELQLEISELLLEDLYLDGSLIIESKTPHDPMGGRCFLKNVKIINKGIDRKASKTYWKNDFSRKEKFRIVLKKNAEFIAEGVTFLGNQTIIVPQNKRLIAFEENGKLLFEEEDVMNPTLWKYQLDGTSVSLSLPHLPTYVNY